MQMRWHWPPENWCGRRSAATAGSMPDVLEHLARPSPRARPWCRSPRSSRGSITMSLTLRRGFSDEIGSWKIICTLVRSWRICLALELGELLALEDDAAAGRAGQLHDGPPGRGLAAARLADEAERLARQHVEADARHGVHLQPGAPDRELDDEVLDAQQRRRPAAGGGPCPCRPSDALSRRSRRRRWPRPRRLSERLVVLGRADRVPAGVHVAGRLGLDQRRLLVRGTGPARTGTGARTGSPAGGLTRSGGRPPMISSTGVARVVELRDALQRAPRCRASSCWRTAPASGPARRSCRRTSRRSRRCGRRRRRGRG